MFCSKCGIETKGDTKFCQSCGQDIKGGNGVENIGNEALSFLKRLLSFDNMVTPVIIKGIYWIGLFFAVLLSFISMFNSFLGGLIALILAPLFIRIWCELLIIMFEIHKNLVQINKKMK